MAHEGNTIVSEDISCLLRAERHKQEIEKRHRPLTLVVGHGALLTIKTA